MNATTNAAEQPALLSDDLIDLLQDQFDCYGDSDAPRIHDFARAVETAVRASLAVQSQQEPVAPRAEITQMAGEPDESFYRRKVFNNGWNACLEAIKTSCSNSSTNSAEAAQPAVAVPEIDYKQLVADCYRTTGQQAGTKGCIGFARGAEWMRERLLATPKGFKLVPIEPTEEMLSAAASTPGMKAINAAAVNWQVRGASYKLPDTAFYEGSALQQAYRAMLAAAPGKETPA